MSKETLLAFPDFTKGFTLHTDASNEQIGGVLSQNGRPLGFFSRKFNSAQSRYTVTQKELLAIVESLKHFRNIVFGHDITVYTDHLNLTYDNTEYNSDRVLRQRLILEEYGVCLVYIKGCSNVVADAHSRLPSTAAADTAHGEELFELDLHEPEFVLDFKVIAREQRSDPWLQQEIKKGNTLLSKSTIGTVTLWLMKTSQGADPKVYVPEILRDNTLDWFHTNLQHPGQERMANTIRQNFTWPKLAQDVATMVATCNACQRRKVTGQKKYGHIPLPDDHQVEPWDSVHVDLIGPWDVKFKLTGTGRVRTEKVKALTIVDKATGWPEVVGITYKRSENIAKLFDQVWLCRYPRPRRVIYDNGSEFIGFEFQEMDARTRTDVAVSVLGAM